LLGKLLRIDVSQGTSPQPPYLVPSDNPFTSATPGKEIWALGLRNPWRYSFDRMTGDLYIADVGQGNWEEVNVDVSTGVGTAGKGVNYGWNVLEGNHCYPPGTLTCNTAGKTPPRIEYDHTGGACSITGGYVYRGPAIPALQGTYFYADFCAGFVRSFRLANGAATQFFEWSALRPGGSITSFGEDGSGELYIMTSDGALYRIVQG
jgi:glucose/arabinose dehydrogenase